MTDIDADVLSNTLSLIYTGSVEIANDELNALKEACTKLCITNLTFSPSCGEEGSSSKRQTLKMDDQVHEPSYSKRKKNIDSEWANGEVGFSTTNISIPQQSRQKDIPIDSSTSSGDTPTFRCSICDKPYQFQISLIKHKKTAHPNN